MTILPQVNEILTLLRQRPANLLLKKIAEDTGVKYGWLSMFNQGKLANPSYAQLKTLYEYLVSLKSKV